MEKTGYAPEAIDLSHHLSAVAKRRVQSPLKGLQKYYGKPGVLSLAGGLSRRLEKISVYILD